MSSKLCKFFENCNLVGATPTKLKKAARSVEVI